MGSFNLYLHPTKSPWWLVIVDKRHEPQFQPKVEDEKRMGLNKEMGVDNFLLDSHLHGSHLHIFLLLVSIVLCTSTLFFFFWKKQTTCFFQIHIPTTQNIIEKIYKFKSMLNLNNLTSCLTKVIIMMSI